MLRIYDSLAGEKRNFEPIVAGKVSLYVCGMTVYDYCHLGHARSMVVFDMIVRCLRFLSYDVTYVRNITDVDDKIIRRAAERGQDWQQLSQTFIEAMHADERALGLMSPDHEPKATAHIAQMITLIESLIESGHAYVSESGDVCFAVESYAEYGALSHRRLENLQSGARITDHDGKRNPLDFVLWKRVKPGEPAWASPWGEGRPGWHIECSAMSTTLLGKHFDIHGGGLDLKFPHHENEIAQSCAGSDTQFANYWVHSGLLTINGEKMSKSLGNFTTIRDALNDYSAESLRYLMLSSHYRSPVNFSVEQMQQAAAALHRLYTALSDHDLVDFEVSEETLPIVERFKAALADDFNTPQALAVCFATAKDVNRVRDTDPVLSAQLAGCLQYCLHVLGLCTQSVADYFAQQVNAQVDAAKVESLIAQRQAARANKDWPAADAIRAQLDAMGVVLEDKAGQTTWRVDTVRH